MGGDIIGAVEHAYDLELDEAAWLTALAGDARLGFATGGPALAYVFEASDRFIVGETVDSEANTELARAVRSLSALLPLEAATQLAMRPPWVSHSLAVLPPEAVLAASRAFGLEFGDALGLSALSGEGHGVVITLPTLARRPPTAREVARWSCVMAHVGSGLRLRRALGAAEPPGEVAILDGSGRLKHATGSSRASSAREQLRSAVRALERARSRRGRGRPEEALTIWQGLVAGRWSLVDRFESDGRRFVVAYENAPGAGDPRGLARREAAAATYVGLGFSNDEIAYALGISNGAVTSAIARARRKLRMSRSELAAHFAPGVLGGSLARVREGARVAVGALDLRGDALDELTAAERDVALGAARGENNRAIASRRGTSSSTVANQLRAAFEKLGVTSRFELAARLARLPAPERPPSRPRGTGTGTVRRARAVLDARE